MKDSKRKLGALMKLKKSSFAIISLLILLNLFQFLWYFNPVGFLGEPLVPNEETAIAIARNFDERVSRRGTDGMVFMGAYIDGNGRWFVRMSPPMGYLGRSYTFVIRARDGRVIDRRIPH